MGELARALVELSGPDAVHGIIPETLLKHEREYKENGTAQDPRQVIDQKTFGRTTVVEDMHARKELMKEEVIKGGAGGGFIAMSGGYGTLEELMEMATWNQLNIHEMPVVVFNIDGFWDGLFQWVKKSVQEGFVAENNEGIMAEARTAEEVVYLSLIHI